MGRRATELLAVFLSAVLLALLWTRPLVIHVGDAVPFDPRLEAPDPARSHGGAWSLWWGSELALGRGGELADDLGSGSTGVGWGPDRSGPLHGLFVAPLVWLVDAPTAHAVALWSVVGLAAAACFALSRELGCGRASAAFVAFAWTFAPWSTDRMLGPVALAVGPWAPLTLLCLHRWGNAADATGRRRRFAAAVGVGLAMGLGALAAPTLGGVLLMLAIGTVLVRPTPARGGASRGGFAFAGSSLAATGAFVLLASLLAPLLPSPDAERGVLDGPVSEAEVSAAPAAVGVGWSAFLLPSDRHPLLAERERPGGTRGGPPFSLFPGLAVASLAATSLVLTRSSRRWILFAAVFELAAWDPLGLWGASRVDWLERIHPVAHLLLVVGAGLGLEGLIRTPGARPVALLFLVVAPLELWTDPIDLADVRPPEGIERIAGTERRGRVLVLPLRSAPSIADSWQCAHGHDIVRGSWKWDDEASLFTPALRRVAFFDTIVEQVERVSAESLALDLRLREVDHVLLPRRGRALEPSVERLLDELPGWVRMETSDPCAWWTRSELDRRASLARGEGAGGGDG